MNVQEHLWGINIGGTKIEGVVLESAQNPQVIFKLRVPTQASEGYPAIKQQVVTLLQTMQRLYKYFGKAVSSIINMIDPDVIVIGGGLGNIDSLYTHGIPEIVPHIFNDTLETAIVKPKLGDSAGVYGAAFLIV